MTKKSQTPKSKKATQSALIEQVIARARTMKPAARAEFLRRHSANEIVEIHTALVGAAKPKTPRPILEKRILHALAEGTPSPAHLDQDMNILVTEHHEAIASARDASAAAPAESTPLDEALADNPDAPASTAPVAGARPEPGHVPSVGTGDDAPAPRSEGLADGGEGDRAAGAADASAGEAGENDGGDAEAATGTTSTSKEPSGPRERDPRLPAVGTVIVKKDRHGTERVRCTIVEGGVEYAGTIYKSISSAAMAAAKDLGLASKTQDGYAFWGLKKATTRTTSKKDPVEGLQKAWDRYCERAAAAVKDAAGEDRPKVQGALQQHLTALNEFAAQVA